MALSYCTIIFIFIQSSIIIVNSSPVVQIKVKRSNICDNVKCLPGYQCCEEGRDACGGNECEQCIDGTFSSGEVGEYCENCNECRDGEVMIKTCTRVEDAVCECPYGNYITNYGVCKPCSICEGEDCKKCNVTATTPKSTPTPLKRSTTPARTTVMTTPSQKTTTSTSIPPTTNNQEEGSSWKDIYLVPIISSSVFVIFVIGGLCICARRSLCCWTRESREFWRNYCPWCCKTTGIEGGNEGIAVSQGNKKSTMCNILAGCCITVQQTGAGDNAANANGPVATTSPSQANGDSEQQSLVVNSVSSENQSNGKSRKLAVKQTIKEGPSTSNHSVTYKSEDETVHIDGPSSSDGKSVPNDGIKSQGDDNISSTSTTDSVFYSRQDSEKSGSEFFSCQDSEKSEEIDEQSLMISKTNGNSKKVVKKKGRRSSIPSLADVPEHGPLSGVLPKWCHQDKQIVGLEHISEISRHIGKEVARIGRILGLTKGEVETIEHDHKSDLARQNFDVLQIWMGKKGVHATKGVLARALDKIGRGELAKEYLWSEQEWKQGTSTTTNVLKTFWKRRSSQSDSVGTFDLDYFKGITWSNQSEWKAILDIISKNDFGDFRELKLACGIVELNQPRLDCVQRCPYFDPSSHSLDQDSIPLMSSQCENLNPVCVPHGVNSLFSAGSVNYYGSDDHFTELKLRTVVELTYHKDIYLKQETLIKCMKAEYALTGLEENDVLTNPDDIEATFENSVRQTLSEQNVFSLQGKSIQMFGLASVLNCNIQSVYPTIGASASSPLNVLITPRKEQENPATVFIMWARHTPLPEDGQFVPNHFVPLLQIPTTH